MILAVLKHCSLLNIQMGDLDLFFTKCLIIILIPSFSKEIARSFI
jgi:hypothetical protein